MAVTRKHSVPKTIPMIITPIIIPHLHDDCAIVTPQPWRDGFRHGFTGGLAVEEAASVERAGIEPAYSPGESC
jgi:hypothetical protein